MALQYRRPLAFRAAFGSVVPLLGTSQTMWIYMKQSHVQFWAPQDRTDIPTLEYSHKGDEGLKNPTCERLTGLGLFSREKWAYQYVPLSERWWKRRGWRQNLDPDTETQQWNDKSQWASTEIDNMHGNIRKSFVQWGCSSTGAGCPQRLQSLHPLRCPNPILGDIALSK